MKIPYTATRRMLQRVPILTPKFNQLILDVWNNSSTMEPTFEEDWETAQQLVLVIDAFYLGEMKIKDKMVHYFKIDQRSIGTRFVWLSDQNFWENPIIPANEISFNEKSWPACNRPHTEVRMSEEGVLRRSAGSIFGRIFSKSATFLSSSDVFGPYIFDDLQKFQNEYAARLCDAPTGFALNKKRNRECAEFNK